MSVGVDNDEDIRKPAEFAVCREGNEIYFLPIRNSPLGESCGLLLAESEKAARPDITLTKQIEQMKAHIDDVNW